MSLGGVVSLVSPNFKFYYSVCAWHWKFCLLTFMLQDTHGLIMHAAEQAGGQREMLLVTLKCTFGWTWPRLSDSSIFFFSLISFRCSSQRWLLLPQCLPFPLASRIHCQACQSAQPLPPCPVNCRQVIALTLFPPTHICNSIGNLKYFVCSKFLFHHVNVLTQVCPQYPCSPPPPAPPSTPSHLWIPPPPASTPPPRYQVGAFYAYFTDTW